MPTASMHGACHDVAAMLSVPGNCTELCRLLEVLLSAIHAEHRLVLWAASTLPEGSAEEKAGNRGDPADMQSVAQLEVAGEVGGIL